MASSAAMSSCLHFHATLQERACGWALEARKEKVGPEDVGFGEAMQPHAPS